MFETFFMTFKIVLFELQAFRVYRSSIGANLDERISLRVPSLHLTSLRN